MTKPNQRYKFLGTALATVFAVVLAAGPAFARDYVQDGAGLFSAATVSSLNAKIGDFQAQTGKEVVVVTVPSLDGQTASAAAEKIFAEQQVNGILVFLAKAEKKDGIIPDRSARAFFPPGSFDSIRQAMRGYFRTGNYDDGITTGVDLVLNDYRGHERSLGGAERQRTLAPATSSSSLGGGMSLFWLILILIAGFLVIRAIFRAMSGPRNMMPPGYGGQPGYGPGPGYGGMGGGMMGGGGGGSFFSGLLGGLGGAFLGNELFNRGNEGGFGGGYGGQESGFVGGDSGQQADAGGWQSDAGQADMGGSSFGDYGSSGGGFDGGGGGFDGGGGGDSGGGW